MSDFEFVKRLLNYDKYTGVFTWAEPRGNRLKGSVAGSVAKNGYIYIAIDGKKLLAHRLAWFFEKNENPKNQIDHINRVKTDNRICNLRPATSAENLQNSGLSSRNTSGFTGVSWDKKNQKWLAHIVVGKKMKNLGRFDDIKDAVSARKKAKIKFHKFHPRDVHE